MRILADENIDRQIIDRLRDGGHEVLAISELDPSIDDEAVLARSNKEVAILLTADKDFGELVFRQRLVHCGILLVRLAGLSPHEKGNLVAGTVERHGEALKFGFSVLTPRSLRVRRRP